MKKNYLKIFNKRLFFIGATLLAVAFIINSCRKDSKVIAQSAPSVSDAKAWYEANYPSTGSSSAFTSRNLSSNSSTSTNPDFTQWIKPDWNHGASYSRLGQSVIELPVDPSAVMTNELKNGVNGNTLYKKVNSKSSFLVLQDQSGYQAFVMTIIADSAYLANDRSKLAKNSYRHIEKDFSGVLYYFTPKGKFINAWIYKNGVIKQKLQGDGGSDNSSTGFNVRNRNLALNTKLNLPAVGKPKVLLTICTDYFMVTFIGDVLVDYVDLGTYCIIGGDQSFPPPGDGGSPSPTGGTQADYGEDDPTLCLNCRIADANFADFLDYEKAQGYLVNTPFLTTFTYNGVDYPGTMTEIYTPTIPPTLVASYFTPNAGSALFQTGMEYRVGTDAQADPSGIYLIGNPSLNPGVTSIGSYTPPSGGGPPLGTVSDDPFTVSDTDPDDAWWDDNTLDFPKQTLPSYSLILSNFPMNPTTLDEIPGPQVYQNVGGAVYNEYLASGNPNACALRLSVALNKSGITIPNVPNQTFQGADGKYYFLSSAKIYNFMVKTFRAPDITLNESDGGTGGSLFEGKLVGKGIFIMKAKSPSLFKAYGHATIYNGFGCVGGIDHCYFNAAGGVSRIALWKLN